MKLRINVHLTTGEIVNAMWDEDTEDNVDTFKNWLTDQTASTDSWQLNFKSTNNHWVTIPSTSILYVEIETQVPGNCAGCGSTPEKCDEDLRKFKIRCCMPCFETYTGSTGKERHG